MTLEEHFSGITDPRRPQGLRTGLTEVLIMVVLSNLCGHFGYRGVARFCSVHGRKLGNLLGLRHGIPSHVTFRDVLRRVDHKEVEAAFNAWASGFVPEGGRVSTDGKALRSTLTMPESKEQCFESAVSLFSHETGLALAVSFYQNAKKGEAGVVRQALSGLAALGGVVCAGALHTQKKRRRPS